MKAKELFLSKLRDKHITRAEFRQNARTISEILAQESLEYVHTKKITIETPIENTTGLKITNSVLLLPILRSGLAMLEPFLDYYKNAKVGVIGLKRDEKTAIAQLYYENIPHVNNDTIVIMLDPMIATGGTALATLDILKKRGIIKTNIIFASIINSVEGLETIKKEYPNITILQAGIDEKLNKDKFIVPGLGDFGDRYYGTE